MHDAESLKRLLGLVPLPHEGGFFRETYRSSRELPATALGPAYGAPRSLATAIYYLLTPDTFSALHRLPGEEIFHFYLGDPVELVELRPDGSWRSTRLGHDLEGGMSVQHAVAGGTWQGSRLVEGGRYALLGTTMAPGFSFDDFELGERDRLLAAYPEAREQIVALTAR